MIWAMTAIAGFLCLWGAYALFLTHGLRIGFRQAVLYAPLRILFWVREGGLRDAIPEGGTLFVISHRSRLDPAMMLALLPSQTLHILDRRAARAWWMEPFRDLARTMAFDPRQVFISRRLVRMLRGGGRVAVYLPDNPEPDGRGFRLYRAVARIAHKSGAAVVVIRVGAGSDRLGEAVREETMPAWRLPPLEITAMAPATIQEHRERAGLPDLAPSSTLFDRVARGRVAALDGTGSILEAVARAARWTDAGTTAVARDGAAQLSIGRLLTRARAIGGRIAAATEAKEPVGLLIPPSAGAVASFLAVQSAGRIAAMLDPDETPQTLARQARMASLRLVLASRERQPDTARIEALSAAGVRIFWLEELESTIPAVERLLSKFMRGRAIDARRPGDPAALLFSVEPGGGDRAVLLSQGGMLANAAQVASRLAIPDGETFFVASRFSSAGALTLGMLLPLLARGQIDAGSGTSDRGIVVGEAGNMEAGRYEAASTRLVLCMDNGVSTPPHVEAGGEPAPRLPVLALDRAGGVVTLATPTQQRRGGWGRLLPGIRVRLDPVGGLERGGRLFIAGPALASGVMTGQAPPRFEPPEDGWLDTGRLALFDREGYLTLLGSADRLAVSDAGAVPLGPGETMANLLWPSARNVCVALPGRRKGERIVLVTTSSEADRAALRRQARALGLGDAVVPVEIVQVPSLDLDPMGRPDIDHALRLALEALPPARAA